MSALSLSELSSGKTIPIRCSGGRAAMFALNGLLLISACVVAASNHVELVSMTHPA
jgi:hypothetical protein